MSDLRSVPEQTDSHHMPDLSRVRVSHTLWSVSLRQPYTVLGLLSSPSSSWCPFGSERKRTKEREREREIL